jgi:hypothetical protein
MSITNSAANFMSEFLWEESDIGIPYAKFCGPDGRQFAIGCDDSAIMVSWHLLEDLRKNYGCRLAGYHSCLGLGNGQERYGVARLQTLALPTPAGITSQQRQNVGMIHSLTFSACGTALSSGGDDRCVRIREICKVTMNPSPVQGTPVNSFVTRRKMILHLQYRLCMLLLTRRDNTFISR